ncbi:hypothetical protein C8R45DRAFT_1104347 [Mycena sanguinolenta]|nr:hypothetical protein C8R45DRAFT_1104347 [Mycena sanguinolenta]
MPQLVLFEDDAYSYLQQILQGVPQPLSPTEARILSSLQTSLGAALPVPPAASLGNPLPTPPSSNVVMDRLTRRLSQTAACSTLPHPGTVNPSKLGAAESSTLSSSQSPLPDHFSLEDEHMLQSATSPGLLSPLASPIWSPLALSSLSPAFSGSPLSSSRMASSPALPLSSPMASSPTLRNSSSPGRDLNSNGKRPFPEPAEAPAAKRITLRIPGSSELQEKIGRGAGAGGGAGGGGGGGEREAHAKPPCKRKGDAKRVGRASDVGVMDCEDPQCNVCGDGSDGGQEAAHDDEGEGESDVEEEHGKKKSRKKAKGKGKQKPKAKYVTTGSGPPLTENASALLGKMVAKIFLSTTRAALDAFLDSLGPSVQSIDLKNGSKDLSAVVEQLDTLENTHVLVFIADHSIRETEALKLKRRPGVEKIAETYHYPSRTFARRVAAGTKLLSLCAASTPYILVIIAVTNMQVDLTGRDKASVPDIVSLGKALRSISHDQWGALVKRLRVPLQYVQQKSTFLSNVNFLHRIPQREGEQAVEYVPFHSLNDTDALFDKISTNAPNLPPRSLGWGETVRSWNIFRDARDLPLPTVRLITMPGDFVKSKCPVTRFTTDEFTAKARLEAELAEIARDLEDLEIKISDPNREIYIEVKSDIYHGNVVRIISKCGKVIADTFTLPAHLRQKLQDAIALVQAAMPGEWKKDDSRRLDYRYLSCHWSWYMRYGEKGHGAPQNANHLDNVQRDHGGKVNFSQRIPYESTDITDRPHEFAILADAYTEIFDYIRITLQSRFPNEYQELSIYCDALPMNSASTAYPFGGFVLNLRVATSAHRDHGDKDLCVVIPFGIFEGSQLCLHEVKLKFDLKMGDVLIFPSCDLTHFNMHFSGKRGTLVLHSDRQGDGWVKDCRGWSMYISR